MLSGVTQAGTVSLALCHWHCVTGIMMAVTVTEYCRGHRAPCRPAGPGPAGGCSDRGRRCPGPSAGPSAAACGPPLAVGESLCPCPQPLSHRIFSELRVGASETLTGTGGFSVKSPAPGRTKKTLNSMTEVEVEIFRSVEDKVYEYYELRYGNILLSIGL